MNYIDISKMIMSGEKINNIPLRVCFYARVSTDSDVQLNSLDNQLNYYKNYITSNSKWIYVDGYIDYGISGVSVLKRESFKRMIRDAKKGMFDLIITKEVSRFARDLEDSIHYIRELKNSNVGVFFENQNINTFDSNSELILNIMFNLAQDESKKLSSRIKFGHRQAINKGHVLGSSNIMGYKKDNCKLVIIEEEAKFITKLFELYATGEYGFYKLSKKLGELGYLNKNGNLYDKDSLKRMIENPKYKGFYRERVTETIDYRTKKRKYYDKDKQIIYKCMDDSIPAIVSEELWDKANLILNSRTKSYSNNNYYTGGLKYSLSSKMYCLEHNHTFQRSHGSRCRNRPTWCCGMYKKYKLEACSSPIIAEKDILNIMGKVFDKLVINKEIIINELLNLYKNTDNNYNNIIENINKNINRIEDKKSYALDLVFNNYLTKEELKGQFSKYNDELKRLNDELKYVLNQIDISEKNNNLNDLSNAILDELNGEVLDDFIRKFVDEIVISKIDGNRNYINLDIYLNLKGEDIGKINGFRHKKGMLYNEKVFINMEKCDTIENLRTGVGRNYFIYSVYIDKEFD